MVYTRIFPPWAFTARCGLGNWCREMRKRIGIGQTAVSEISITD
jgi:hypothetical protein